MPFIDGIALGVLANLALYQLSIRDEKQDQMFPGPLGDYRNVEFATELARKALEDVQHSLEEKL